MLRLYGNFKRIITAFNFICVFTWIGSLENDCYLPLDVRNPNHCKQNHKRPKNRLTKLYGLKYVSNILLMISAYFSGDSIQKNLYLTDPLTPTRTKQHLLDVCNDTSYPKLRFVISTLVHFPPVLKCSISPISAQACLIYAAQAETASL